MAVLRDIYRYSGLVVLVWTQLFKPAAPKTTVLQDVLINGTVTEEAVLSDAATIDGPKLSSVSNATTYEWWYFDAVSSKNESLDVVFYNVGPDGFIGGYVDGPLSVSVSGTFANGSEFDFDLAVTGKATITEDESGITGVWAGTGISFRGSKGDSSQIDYVIEFDNCKYEIYGTVTLRGRAPPRLPCTPSTAGNSELAFPTVYWNSAQPDADAIVALSIAGTPFGFTGTGYHDHNWGISPFVAVTAQSYWGRARAGPYSVVWADALIATDPSAFAGNLSALKEYASNYVAYGGELDAHDGVSCGVGSAVVRPWGTWGSSGNGGDGAAYPPLWNTSAPAGFEVTLKGGKGGEDVVLNVTTSLVVENDDVYQRFIGNVVGGVKGGPVYTGRALYEQFKFIGVPAGLLP